MGITIGIVTSLYYHSDLSIRTMTQQVDLPQKEVHWFNKIRCPEVTRRTEHYYGGEIIPTDDVISFGIFRTVIDETILVRQKKSRL